MELVVDQLVSEHESAKKLVTCNNSFGDYFPNDVWLNIFNLILNGTLRASKLPYQIFHKMECVSFYWFKYLNSKKMYLYIPTNYNPTNYTPTKCSDVYITTNKSVKCADKRKNERITGCCSIYLDYYPNIEKCGQMKFFRKEFHNFRPELPQELAKKYNHDISKLHFPISVFNLMRISAELYTKYEITSDSLWDLRTDYMYIIKHPDFKGKSKLHILKYYYSEGSEYFFSMFNAPNKKGKIVKSRYPNHYVIFNDIYRDKLGELDKKDKLSDNSTDNDANTDEIYDEN